MQGILHRDLKPENILYCSKVRTVSEHSEGAREAMAGGGADDRVPQADDSPVKIIDFGLCVFLEVCLTGARAHLSAL